MRVFIIDTTHMGPELQRGLIGVVGSPEPDAAEKIECVEEVSRLVAEGWAIAADPNTPIGRLAAMTAETACVPFLAFNRVPQHGGPVIEPGTAIGPIRQLS